MTTLTITQGLPGCGKTTWARTQPGVRMGRDGLRATMRAPWPHGDASAELQCTIAQHAAIRALLTAGHDVIADDTNLDDRVVDELSALAADCGARVIVHDMRHVDVGLCIARDAGRPDAERVGKDRIRQMAKEAGL